jgi:hypothetical protein
VGGDGGLDSWIQRGRCVIMAKVRFGYVRSGLFFGVQGRIIVWASGVISGESLPSRELSHSTLGCASMACSVVAELSAANCCGCKVNGLCLLEVGSMGVAVSEFVIHTWPLRSVIAVHVEGGMRNVGMRNGGTRSGGTRNEERGGGGEKNVNSPCTPCTKCVSHNLDRYWSPNWAQTEG